MIDLSSTALYPPVEEGEVNNTLHDKLTTEEATNLFLAVDDMFIDEEMGSAFALTDFNTRQTRKGSTTMYEYTGMFEADSGFMPDYVGCTFIIQRMGSSPEDGRAHDSMGARVTIIGPSMEIDDHHVEVRSDTYTVLALPDKIYTSKRSDRDVYKDGERLPSAPEMEMKSVAENYLNATGGHSDDPIEAEEFHQRLDAYLDRMAREIAAEHKAFSAIADPEALPAEFDHSTYCDLQGLLNMLRIWGIPLRSIGNE